MNVAILDHKCKVLHGILYPRCTIRDSKNKAVTSYQCEINSLGHDVEGSYNRPAIGKTRETSIRCLTLSEKVG